MNETNNSSKTLLGIGLAVVFVVVLAVIFVYRAQKPDIIPAPTSFTKYSAMDNSFTCDMPQGWDSESSSAGALNSGALFERDGAKIDISTDLAGSLTGDITRATNAQLGDMMPGMAAQLKSPVEVLHERGEDSMRDKYGDYDEQPYKKFNATTGEACFSEFTGTGGILVGRVHGYRVTMLTSERHVSIICVCPESSWTTLKPAFQKVIESFAAGKG